MTALKALMYLQKKKKKQTLKVLANLTISSLDGFQELEGKLSGQIETQKNLHVLKKTKLEIGQKQWL